MTITEELLDELRDIQLCDNRRAWVEIEEIVCRYIPPLERQVSFLTERVKFLESEIDVIVDNLT